MKDSTFLIISKTGILRAVKGRRSKYAPMERPHLNAGEYAVLISIVVPDSVFTERPTPEATITVPETAVITPRVAVEVETFDE